MEGLPDDAMRKHIRNFLQDFKELMNEGKFNITERVINQQALSELALTERQRTEEILSLSVENYSAGPEKDEYKPGDN